MRPQKKLKKAITENNPAKIADGRRSTKPVM